MPNVKEVKMDISAPIKGGVYSNIAHVYVSKSEVMIDFIFRAPKETILVSRVILPIEHAKSLKEVMSNLLKDK